MNNSGYFWFLTAGLFAVDKDYQKEGLDRGNAISVSITTRKYSNLTG